MFNQLQNIETMKHANFNTIKRIINNPLNNVNHLPALENLVKSYKSIFGVSNLSLRLEAILTIKSYDLVTKVGV